MPNKSAPLITRFAPSPTGWLHLGHAYAALWAARIAGSDTKSGHMLLRIEDIDKGRARAHFRDGIEQDLSWLGLEWAQPVWQQSQRFAIYEAALQKLRDAELVYPCWATRSEIAHAIAQKTAQKTPEKTTEKAVTWARDPEGTPLYPGLYRTISESQKRLLLWEGKSYAWRLDMERALASLKTPISYQELDVASGQVRRLPLDPAIFGDVVLARKDIPSSYHLSVVVDDAMQNVTHVTRGRDLQSATAVHRLLQILLGLPEPIYMHHRLVQNPEGRKLSKRAGDSGLRQLRQDGMSAAQVIALLPPPFGLAP